ncbi:MAG: iron-sulfur cluster assembly scaffold protein [Candidatus Gottesmanbacteria bacterium]
MDIYRQNILDHYKNPRNFGPMEKPDSSHEEGNTLCGDKIKIEIKYKLKPDNEKTIDDIKFTGEGCAISLASASMLTEKVKGMTIEDIKKLRYDDIKEMLGTDLSPARIKCATLALQVLLKTIDHLIL